jgi:poly-gamma-glutamate synthase PgsB/CapB
VFAPKLPLLHFGERPLQRRQKKEAAVGHVPRKRGAKMGFALMLLSAAVLIVLGVWERQTLNRNVKKIPLRINVNGIRGKSTATRFITSILEEAGYQVVGKTTGTSARMLIWGQEDELAIKRRPVGPNIGEQVSVIKKAAELGANALVCECMAVKPEYQEVYQHQIIQANIVVITNVVEDHLDEMGPTTDQIALAFGQTIPYDGTLVITKGDYSDYFGKIAAQRHTRVICIDPASVEESFLRQFPYLVFPNNCAIGYGLAQALGIDQETAERAMLKAHPDPGSTSVLHIDRGEHHGWLVNAFAANEPTSSLEIWEDVAELKQRAKQSVLVLCCRDDRVDRTHQFAVDFLPYIHADRMLVIGTGTKEILESYQKERYPGIEQCVDLTEQGAEEIIAEVEANMDDCLIFCAGNIHGVAEAFLEDFAAIKI